MSIIFSKHHSQKPYVPLHHQQHSVSTYCQSLPFQSLFYLPFNSKPASFQSPLLIQLLPLPCCHGYTFSPESRKRGGGQECEKERGAVNGGGEDCTEMMRTKGGRKDRGAEVRKPSGRDERLQPNAGWILHVFLSVTTNPHRLLLVPLSVSKQIFSHHRYGQNWRQICCVIFRPGLICWIYLQLLFRPLIQREERETNLIILTFIASVSKATRFCLGF